MIAVILSSYEAVAIDTAYQMVIVEVSDTVTDIEGQRET